ncbi:MAG: hypothetical protein MJZ92_03410 [Paludibacteraceae bacterium]|nr:hypothetical protein [Paludibacteraceae bacterium]
MREDIQDTEIRIIGGTTPQPRFPWKWVLLGVVGVAIVAIILCLTIKTDTAEDEQGVFEQEVVAPQPHPLQAWIASLDTVTAAGTVIKDTMVNDISLRIYAPLNATPRLEIGYGVLKDREHNILLFQAADIRADNKKIVGAFVLRGQPLSWGLSKKGYCAIIDNQITVGTADNSSLFEEATEKEGYFFRQYSLVDNGQLVESELKAKSIRRALCELEGKIVVVGTQTQESMHDFAQALVDIGTTNAIYLVGSTAIGWSMDTEGNGTKMGLWDARAYKNISFIVWSK